MTAASRSPAHGRASTASAAPRRSAHPAHIRRPTGREHPARHSYADRSLGPPTSVALPPGPNPVRQPTIVRGGAPAPIPSDVSQLWGSRSAGQPSVLSGGVVSRKVAWRPSRWWDRAPRGDDIGMGTEDGYLLDNRQVEAGQRFAALATLFDPSTFRHLGALGL